MIFVTGGAGFIGANFVLQWLACSQEGVVNLDLLSYAGTLANLRTLEGDARHVFQQGDIADGPLLAALLARHRPRAVIHFAAETHVDRSIRSPQKFIETNVNGSLSLLGAVHAHWSGLPPEQKTAFRFLHVSTDEVYGALGPADPPFTEHSPYAPNSPYAASKAASDHLVRAFGQTYGLPTLTVHSSNNYGPMQFPEKLIPLMITRALSGGSLPVYGDGLQVRDWIHVDDHCAALRAVLAQGAAGAVYNVGAEEQLSNLEVVHAICDVLDELVPTAAGSYRRQLAFVADRPGHDRRYAIDTARVRRETGWAPRWRFAAGIRRTVASYLEQGAWRAGLASSDYQAWLLAQYGQAGTGAPESDR